MSQKLMIHRIPIANEQATRALARNLAGYLEIQDVVTLNGTLGAGKTAFARALIQSLCGADIEVPSPTFNLLLTYESDQAPIYHYDFYRLEDPEEVWELDIEDAYEEGITVIEWGERLQGLAPVNDLSVTLSIPEKSTEGVREILISGNSNWQYRLKNMQV